MFAAEAARVSRALPRGLILAIEHFGSTAIPNMVAKPIIDLLVAVRSIQEARETAVGPMEALGYAFWSDNPRRDRLFFVKGLPPAASHRTHHVHMTELDGDLWHRLLFRDYLRSHPDEAQRYATLKRSLALQPRPGSLHRRQVGLRRCRDGKGDRRSFDAKFLNCGIAVPARRS